MRIFLNIKRVISKLTPRRFYRWTLPVIPVNTYTGTVACRPALYDMDQFVRIKSCGFGRPLKEELAKLNAKEYAPSSHSRGELKDVFFYQGKLIVGSITYSLCDGVERNIPEHNEIREYDQVSMPLSVLGMRYFGHWLRDDCSAYEICRKEKGLCALSRPGYSDAKVYSEIFDQLWNAGSLYAKRLEFISDIGFSPEKAERLRELRRKLRDKIRPLGSGKTVYLRRGATAASRDIENSEELELALDKMGVKILSPEAGSQKFLEELTDADLIVSVEGSQLAHAVYTLKDRGSLLVLQPPDRFYNSHLEWARTLDVRYGIVIGESGENGFRIYPDEVERMIDKLHFESDKNVHL